jgi:2'-5' RNA ligase
MFVAVVPPDEALADLDAFLEPRRGAGDFRWAAIDQLHVTVAFLAEVPDRALDDLEARLERAAKRRTAIATALVGGGAFPSVGQAAWRWRGWRPGRGPPRARPAWPLTGPASSRT